MTAPPVSTLIEVMPVASDLIGRRVRVWYNTGNEKPDIVGPVHAVGVDKYGLALLVEQESNARPDWYPKGELNVVHPGPDKVQLEPKV